MKARRSRNPARRRIHIGWAAAALFAVSLALGAGALTMVPTPSPAPALTSIPIGEVDTLGNWSETSDPQDGVADRLLVVVGTTSGYMRAGDWTDLCAHVGTSAQRDFAGASVTFEASAGALRDNGGVTGADGVACTRFLAPDDAGQVVVTASATDGQLRYGAAENLVEVYGSAQPTGPNATLLFGAVLAALAGISLVGRLGAGRSASASRLRSGRWLLGAALALAVLALLADVANAPPSATAGDVEHAAAAEEENHEASHASAAIAFAAGGVAAASYGLVLRHRDLWQRKGGRALLVALPLLYLDGVIHWLAVSEHTALPLHATFFVAVGSAQVFVALVAPRSAGLLWWVGVVLTSSMMALYFLTRLSANPFSGSPEPFEALGLFSKSVEAALLVLVLYALARHSILVSPKLARLLGRKATQAAS